MKKILINIKQNNIIFSYKTNNSSISNDLINTNIISDNELIFSDKYIAENTKILSSFVKELAIQYNIKSVIITKMELANIVLTILTKSTSIETIFIKDDENLSYSVCESIINLKYIKTLNCYTIPPFMIELLDKNGITCETRSEILYISNFMEQNNLIRYSNIYYKTNIRINLPLSLEDLKDFQDFCKVNKYLKTIHINKLIITELESIIKVLIVNNKTNIKVIIHENINDEKTINALKEINKNNKRKHKILLDLQYTQEYLDKNLFTQTLNNMLKVCGLIISSLVVLVVTYIGISNYISLKEDDSIKNDLKVVIESTEKEDLNEIIDKKNDENKNEAEENNEPIEQIKLIINERLASLLSVNDDIIGELKVNNTNVDYPVVQTTDNDYYLDHNINKEKNINGWVYMDYRNNSMNIDKNNIIYGHNMYYSGVMFGTLHKTINKSWYTNPDNQIITYNTLYDNMKFRIFSIYRIPKTNDYLKVFFKDDDDFLEFITKMTERSIYNFNVPVTKDDKILTLSTCSDNGAKRLVIHAVLINEASE